MPEAIVSRNDAQRSFLKLGSAVLVIACLYWAQKIFIPITLAVLFAFILSPLVVRLQRSLGRGLAVLVVVLLTGVVLFGLGWVFLAQLNGLVKELPQRKQEINQKIEQIKDIGPGPWGDFIGMMQDISGQMRGAADKAGAKEPMPVVVVSEVSPYLEWGTHIVGPVLEALVVTLFVVILVVFMLLYREDLRNRFITTVGVSRLNATTHALDDATYKISRFLFTQLLINGCFGAAWALILRFTPGGETGLGVPYAFLWGALAAVFRFIPYVGTWFGLALPLLLSLATSSIEHPWLQPGILVAAFVTLELVTANVIEPLLFGHNTGLSPVALLVAAFFWAWLWGAWGLILATPLTVCMVVLGRFVPQLKILETLLSSEIALRGDASYYQRLLARDEDEAVELIEDHLKTHPAETIYDDLLVPALSLAKHDDERGVLSSDEKEYILQTTGRLLDEVLGPRIFTPEHPPLPVPTTGCVAVGYPARESFDYLAVRMLEQMLAIDGLPLEVMSENALVSELLARLHARPCPVLCLTALPPGGSTHIRYLMKRVLTEFPKLRIILCQFGTVEELDKLKARYLEAGASTVVTSLLEARNELVPLLRPLVEPTRPAVPAAPTPK